MMRRRDEIEGFCRNSRHLYEVISNYRYVLARIDIQQMKFTQGTFDDSFRSICNEVFIHTPAMDTLSMFLVFHCSSSWYTIDIC